MTENRPVLVASEPFGAGLDAARVAAAVGRGLERAGLVAPDVCVLEDGDGSARVGAPGFDARLRAARAVVIGTARLDDATLRGSPAADVATRARQAGVPCHAVVAVNALDRFGARLLDLQAVLEASTEAELEAAGEALAGYV